ncbi:MAG TPA: helix-turn-helix domain-containing protein [Chitinophagaceae bacterium]|nr:helix-turn-helix domain-containing protein [Chitinophagaceae bacterium]
MSVFNPEEQNKHTDSKIVAGIERLSQVFRTLLWDQAKAQQLSPIQVQLLIFIRYHNPDKNNVSYLAREFGVTKPTISDAVRVLEEKGLVGRIVNETDNRRYSLALSRAGEKAVAASENFTAPFSEWLAQRGQKEKEALWQSLSGLIAALNENGSISIQRHCFNCTHYRKKSNGHFCTLLEAPLHTGDLRMDCPEHREH